MNRYRVRPASRPQPSLIPLILILAVALALAACGARQASAPPPAAAPAEAELVILHTNDHHGHPLKYDLPGCPGAGVTSTQEVLRAVQVDLPEGF